MRKSDRLFQLVNLIRVHQPVTAKTLSEKLGVSIRSIYRYIDDLSVSGIPVYGEAGIGYVLDEKFELPPLTLTSNELLVLSLSVNMLSRSSGHELTLAAKSLHAKISATLPVAKLKNESLNVMSLAEPLSETHRHFWDTLRIACDKRQRLSISYLSLKEAKSQRTALPLGLFYWGGKWTVGTWCLLREEYRDFRVDRIQTLKISDTKENIPNSINLEDYIDYHNQSKK